MVCVCAGEGGKIPTSFVVAARPPSADRKILLFFPLPQFAFFLHPLGGLLVEFWCVLKAGTLNVRLGSRAVV